MVKKQNTLIVLASACIIFIITAVLFIYLNYARDESGSYRFDINQMQEQSQSTQIEDIEKDLDDTQLEDLDKELEDIEKELENAL